MLTSISVFARAASLTAPDIPDPEPLPVPETIDIETRRDGTQVATVVDGADVTVTGAAGSKYAGLSRRFDPALLASGPVDIGLLAPTPAGPYSIGNKITFDLGLWAHDPDLGLVTFASVITLVSTGAVLTADLKLTLPIASGTIRQTVTATQGANVVAATRDTVL
ncbi:hypothetical protein ACOI1H_07290 [Loktanella sp. DJP18]|uniref:hypothetical protein n=1 Tax=Loktanella sp. DJP18 TaxID=3409788 RepID=UPI003BB6838E